MALRSQVGPCGIEHDLERLPFLLLLPPGGCIHEWHLTEWEGWVQ